MDCQAGPQWCVEKFGWLFGVALCCVLFLLLLLEESILSYYEVYQNHAKTQEGLLAWAMSEKSVGSRWIFHDFGLLVVLWKLLDFEDVKF